VNVPLAASWIRIRTAQILLCRKNPSTIRGCGYQPVRILFAQGIFSKYEGGDTSLEDPIEASCAATDNETKNEVSASEALPLVLLVDDQPARLLTYESVLSGVGVTCVRALSGEEALGRLLKQTFALILLDVSMPGMDGFETARAIREHPRFERTPIIFVTGVHVSEIDTLRGYEVGAIDYISVPLVPEILRSKVALLVELYKRRTELDGLNRALESARRELEQERQHRSQPVGTQVALRLNELRSRALLRLADTSRTVTNPIDLAHAAAQILGETLSVSRCGYGTMDLVAETITVERDWCSPGVMSLAGKLNFREYGSYVDDLKRGETVICSDVRLDPRTRANSDRLEALGARAFVNMPIVENGSVVALLFLNHAAVREWTDEELGFFREAAGRTRIAVERRRHEEAIAADLTITTLLRDLATREVSDSAVNELSKEILSAAIAIVEADGGTLQLLDEPTQELYFAATLGLDPALVAHFSRVNATSKSPCGVALASGKRSFVDYDAPAPDDPDGTLRVHFEHGLRFGQSTPLITRTGRALGMITTHWVKRPEISERELRYLDLLARQTADLVERTQAEQALRISTQELRDADRRKDEFIAMLAHELRNPLVPIRTAIELLKKSSENPSVVETIRPMMERQVKHMVRLIDGLLDVSRVTSGKMELSREAVSVSTLITGAVEANREALNQGGIALAMNIGRPDLIVDVDATRFTQILSNLLNNAAKFTPPGGQVSVCDSLDRGQAGDCWLSITVTDTGIGISQELLPRIFDLFAQAESAGRNRHRGIGIGLALARRLAEMHWGTLEARSNGLNQGSSFVLRIPIREPKPSEESTDSQPALALTGLRVLVIDDTRDAADVMQMLIESDGGIADVAYDGASGVTLAQDNEPEVILLDIGMPDMDGYETCRAIRKLVGKNVLIIAMTGWGQEEVKRRALEAGFDAHLTKPVNPDKLTDLIHQLRDRSRSNH
jgi:signal transduction histidine kinase/DNA-binding response OmpR family regulator